MVNSLIVFRVGSKRQKPSRLPLLAPIGVGSEGKRLSKGVYSMRIEIFFVQGLGLARSGGLRLDCAYFLVLGGR